MRWFRKRVRTVELEPKYCVHCGKEINFDNEWWLDRKNNVFFCKEEHVILHTFNSGEVIIASKFGGNGK